MTKIKIKNNPASILGQPVLGTTFDAVGAHRHAFIALLEQL